MRGSGTRRSGGSRGKSLGRRALGIFLIFVAVAANFAGTEPARQRAFAQNIDTPNAERPAQVLILPGSIDGTVAGRVRNVALSLQADAMRTGRDALLVLEIAPGTSRFGAVRDLAQFLTSSELSHVETIAWIPESVDGNNVLVALASDEIVMHPDAELGDMGRGAAVDPADADFVMRLVRKGHNPKVNAALAQGMLDPQVRVLRATIGAGADAKARVVTAEELKELQAGTDEQVLTQTIKEAGLPGKFSGSAARRFDILATGTARTRQDLAALYQLPSSALRPDPTLGEPPRVAYIKINGVIEPVVEQFVQRQIDRVVGDGANLIIFEIDSPGGLLSSSEQLAHYIAELDPQRVKTVAYVPEEALSGAAMISLGCDEIYMAPNAILGDAAPIETRDGQAFDRVPEKLLSAVRVMLRDLGEANGRPGALCAAMADKDLLVYQATNRDTGRIWYMTESAIHRSAGEWIQGPLVPESREGNLLTVNGERAHILKLAQPPVVDIDDLKQRLGIPAKMTLHPVGRTWVDSLIFFLNQPVVGGALITLGILLIYLELHFMTGLLAILSVLCFSLFFWSKYLGGTSGWLEVVLFAIGLGCIVMEMFVVPGFGVFGASGGLLIIGALILASQTFGNFSPGSDFRQMTQTIGVLSGAIITTIVCAVLISRYLPRMPILGGMVLAPPGSILAEGPQLRAEEGVVSLVGQRGLTRSPLRPVGKAEIDGDYLDVFSEGGFIDANTEIEVVRHEGNRIFVREIG